MSATEATLGGLPIAAGDLLLKKYRIERLIGEGGTGVVLSATHVQLQQRVAIKFLRRALASEEIRTRFEREARAMGKIESEHVVLVLDAGVLDDGAPYMVMEYLDGRDLARVLKEDGALPVEQAVDCMLQVCEALREAHAHGIVHRDLKPANLFLTRQDDEHVHVKVVDFGISKILDKKLVEGDGKPHEVTSAFTVLGSPRYMAPEQLRNSKEVDGRADLWSVGAVLFQLLTGKHPFAGEGNVQASIAVLSDEPLDLTALAPHAPAALAAVVGRCLEKDVAERFQSAADLAEALRPFASDRARESVDRLRSAKRAPSERISVSESSTSRPPPELASESRTLATGTREVPTERRIRVSGASPAHRGSGETPIASAAPGAPAPPVPSRRPAPRGMSRALIGALGAFAVVLIAAVGIRYLGSARLFVASSSAHPPLAVPLDAGRSGH